MELWQGSLHLLRRNRKAQICADDECIQAVAAPVVAKAQIYTFKLGVAFWRVANLS